jgi:hypothetical protein
LKESNSLPEERAGQKEKIKNIRLVRLEHSRARLDLANIILKEGAGNINDNSVLEESLMDT